MSDLPACSAAFLSVIAAQVLRAHYDLQQLPVVDSNTSPGYMKEVRADAQERAKQSHSACTNATALCCCPRVSG